MATRRSLRFKKGGRMDYTAASNVAREAEETGAKHGGRKHHHRKAGGKVPGLKSGGRADKFARGGHVKGSNKAPFSSATQSVDHGRTTHNVGANPAGDWGSGSHHAGGHHGHALHGHKGHKDHPGHHFASGGAVKEEGFKHGGPVMHHKVHGSGVHKDHAHKGRMHFHHKHGHHHKKTGGAVEHKADGGPVTMKQVFASGGLIRGPGGRFAKGGAAKASH